jgi:hypothetical protein
VSRERAVAARRAALTVSLFPPNRADCASDTLHAS